MPAASSSICRSRSETPVLDQGHRDRKGRPGRLLGGAHPRKLNRVLDPAYATEAEPQLLSLSRVHVGARRRTSEPCDRPGRTSLQPRFKFVGCRPVDRFRGSPRPETILDRDRRQKSTHPSSGSKARTPPGRLRSVR